MLDRVTVFLKSIELFGFKSFADRSRLEFQEGVSALLGPNGCGKSNVVDAIRWVLGEQSSRSLRAERMEDVIFNGSENRKPLNVAEVTLTLSNDEGLLPVEFTEIAVKRRVYRSGESEYFLNATPIKLRELRELFYDTGIGKSSYSILEQGKIDQILSSRPEERRNIFEEAAGITKYRAKGVEAEKKLEHTEENMRQVESILSEVKRSYETLKLQSEKTSIARELKDQIFAVELDLLLLRLSSFVEERETKSRRLGEKTRERDELRARIETINKAQEQGLDVVNSMEAALIESQKKLYGVGLEKSNKQTQLALLTERRAELERQLQSAEAREQSFKERIRAHQEQIVERERALDESRKRITEIEENITTFEQSILTATGRIRQNEQDIAGKEAEIKTFEARQEKLGLDLRAITDDIVTQLDSRLRDSGYSLQTRKAAEEALETALRALRIHVEGKLRILDDALRLDRAGELLAEQSVGALREALSGVDRLASSVEAYKRAVPTFLDEFLAAEGIITRKREIDTRIEEVVRNIVERRERTAALREENRGYLAKIEDYRKTLEDLRVNRAKMSTQVGAIEEGAAMLRREMLENESRVADISGEIATCNARSAEIAGQVKAIEEERLRLDAEESALSLELRRLESGISSRNKELFDRVESLKSAREVLEKNQSALEQLQIDLAGINTEIRTIHDNFQETHSRDLSEFEGRMGKIAEEPRELRARLSEIREREKALGQVNLMAPEEFAEVKDRFEFLNGQIGDLRKAKEDLKKITSEIRTESTELFLDSYERIQKSFHTTFRRLFGGGRAEIKLVDPENVLESGIDIYAQPPGKKLENIALLSGGERSLTAVALLFATYSVRPSPFCVLDEIDAALDEENVDRFVNLLIEFGAASQFVVISHNKKTVTGARTLLGVTMEESGVSKIISVRIGDAREAVEA